MVQRELAETISLLKDTTKMNRGELEWRSKGHVSVVTWIDKKSVHVAGTVTKTPGSEEQTMVIKQLKRLETTKKKKRT